MRPSKIWSIAAALIAVGLAAPAHALTQTVSGEVRCITPNLAGVSDVPLPFVPIRIENGAGPETTTDANGLFNVAVTLAEPSAALTIRYRAAISSNGATTPLEVMNDLHNTRRDQLKVTGAEVGSLLKLGRIEVRTLDCELWRLGVDVLNDYHALMGATPAVGQLRIKRWDNVVVGGAHTYYDYIPVPTDFLSERPGAGQRRCTIYHEFGHDVFFPIDGDKTHWDGDLMAYAYGREHDGNEITNVHYAFSEGWGDYWSKRASCDTTLRSTLPDVTLFRDWNEWHVADQLQKLASSAGPRALVETLQANRGKIHSLEEFSAALKARVPSVMISAPAADCPVGFKDDGATCRRDSVPKPSYTRGAGSPLSQCAAGQDRSGALCYPRCPSGFTGAGPVCWQTCPPGTTDDGATCRRDAKIISADNSSCPGYDKCGLTFSKGCSRCPAGYKNDGCTCRVDVQITSKQSKTRGAGSPLQCAPGQEQNGALCYARCTAGYSGAGPVCWGACPAGTRDDGATCFQPTLVLIK